jgi:hypothetical protein
MIVLLRSFPGCRQSATYDFHRALRSEDERRRASAQAGRVNVAFAMVWIYEYATHRRLLTLPQKHLFRLAIHDFN